MRGARGRGRPKRFGGRNFSRDDDRIELATVIGSFEIAHCCYRLFCVYYYEMCCSSWLVNPELVNISRINFVFCTGFSVVAFDRVS